MGRDFLIAGECLVKVKGGAHLSGQTVGSITELGLTSDDVKITPVFKHKDIHVDDFGPDVPAEILYNLAEVKVSMTLIHFDREALNVCLEESMAGGGGGLDAGVLAPGGSLMGNGRPLLASGNHFLSLNLTSPVANYPWRFPASFLSEQPLEFPIGTSKTGAKLNWRVIPYTPGVSGEIRCSGVILWDHVPQT